MLISMKLPYPVVHVWGPYKYLERALIHLVDAYVECHILDLNDHLACRVNAVTSVIWGRIHVYIG